MQIVPCSRLIGMNSAAPGDAPPNDRDSLGLMLHDCRHGRAAPLAHHHDAAALSVLVFAPTPVDPRDADDFPGRIWPPNHPPSISTTPLKMVVAEFDCQSASQLVQQDERGFRMHPEIAAQLKTADALGGVDEQTESHQQGPKRELSAREQGPAGRRKLPVAGLAFEHAGDTDRYRRPGSCNGDRPGRRRCRATASGRAS